MATRSRTLLFLQYRNSYTRSAFRQRTNTHDNSESAGLLGQEVAVEMAVLPPKWVDIVEDVNEDMHKIKEKISELDGMHKRHLLPGFGEKLSEEKEIEILTREITLAFQRCQKKIVECQQDASNQGNKQSTQISKNIQISLASKLQDLSQTFRKSQSDYLQSNSTLTVEMQGRSAKPRPLISSFGPISTKEDDDLDSVFTDAQTQQMENTDRLIDQRDKEINQVVESINGLATIFKELQTMVIDQGTILDRIDYNIEQTAVYVEDAHKELVKASKYQDNSKAKWCILLLVLVIFILLTVIILKPKRNTSSTNVEAPSTSTPSA